MAHPERPLTSYVWLQVEWARFLITLNKHAPAIWFVPKARLTE